MRFPVSLSRNMLRSSIGKLARYFGAVILFFCLISRKGFSLLRDAVEKGLEGQRRQSLLSPLYSKNMIVVFPYELICRSWSQVGFDRYTNKFFV